MRYVFHKKASIGEVTKREAGQKGLFGGKPHIKRDRFKRILGDAPRYISGANKFSREERKEMEGRLFPKREYGEYISPYEINKRIRKFKKELYQGRGEGKKLEIRRNIDFLKKVRGPKDTI